ncbi:MAG: DUF5777 family beta-barrel protein [Chitinophagales bacterium]
MFQKYILFSFLMVLVGFSSLQAQQDPANLVYETFLGTRLIHTHTNETVEKGKLDILITHRFGDMAGELGGFNNFFGFDNLADVRIAFEYGVSQRLTLGVGRSKGFSGPLKLVDGLAKYRLLQQTVDNKMPFSVTLYGNAVVSHAKATEDPSLATSFQKFAHRMSFDAQMIIARKFSDRFSLQVMPNFLHRNFVAAGDENNNFSIGIAGRVALSKHIGLIFDYYQFFSAYRDNINNQEGESLVKYYNPLGIGLEIKTGGHVFLLNFSNSPGIIENQYLPYTNKNWGDGEFRLGFNISRPIQL